MAEISHSRRHRTRYSVFSEGILAVIYGPAAIQFVQANYGKVGLGLAFVIVASAVIFFLTRRRVGNIEA